MHRREDRRGDWFCDEVREHLPELLGLARRLTGNEADAEDLVGDAVASAWKGLDGLSDPGAFGGWIARILINRFISDERRRDARPASEPFEEEAAAAEPGFSLFEHLHRPFLLWWSDPERAFLQRLLREDLERAIDALPYDFQVAVVLCDLQGLSYREIGETLELPIGTVKSRLARGRSLLQRALWEHARESGVVDPPHSPEPEPR